MRMFALMVLILNIYAINMFDKVELTTKNGAMCMDGSPYAIYVY